MYGHINIMFFLVRFPQFVDQIDDGTAHVSAEKPFSTSTC